MHLADKMTNERPLQCFMLNMKSPTHPCRTHNHAASLDTHRACFGTCLYDPLEVHEA